MRDFSVIMICLVTAFIFVIDCSPTSPFTKMKGSEQSKMTSHQTPSSIPIPDDPNLPKQHALLTRAGKNGQEVLMIGSQKSNSQKGLGMIRGKAQKGEKIPLDTIRRETLEEGGFQTSKAKKIQGPFRGSKNTQTQGYIIHLPPNSKPIIKGEEREMNWIHHSKVENHLKNRPEMKDLYNSMKGKINEANEYNKGRLTRSNSFSSSTTTHSPKSSQLQRSESVKAL